MSSTTDEFYDARLCFGIRKPRPWRFRPSAWSPAAEPAPLSSIDWARCSRLPFVSIVRDIRSYRHPRPMVSVGCRPVDRHGSDEIRRLLARQVEVVRAELEDVDVLDATYDTIVGGYRAAHVRFRYSQKVSGRRGPWVMRVLARSYLVLTPGLAFTIGMSSSGEAQFGVPEEFAAMLSTIRIGRARERMQQPGAAVAAGADLGPALPGKPARDNGGRNC